MNEDDKPASEASKPASDASPEEAAKDNTDRVKQLNRVVCICKGIPLSKVLEGLPGSETVMDVNRKVGTGSGGCQGERCGPRIKLLIRKYKEKQKRG